MTSDATQQPTQGITPDETATQALPLLHDARFQLFLLARIAVQTAQIALLYVLLVIVIDTTGSSVHTSLFVLCSVLPSVLLGLPAGTIVDFLPNKLVAVLANLLRAVLCVLLLRSDLSVWNIYLITLGLWSVHQFYAPAESAALPALVHRERFVSANAWFNFALTAAQLLGAVILAPFTLKTVGPRPLFVIAMLLFLAAGIALLVIPGLSPGRATWDRRLGVRAALAQGWSVLRRDQAAYQAIVEYILVGTAMGTLLVLLPHYMQRILDTSSENTVFVFAPAAIGVVIGLRTTPYLSRHLASHTIVSLGFFLFALCMAGFAFVHQFTTFLQDQGVPLDRAEQIVHIPPVITGAMILSLPAGLAFSLVSVAARTVLYERAPVESRARVFATQNAIANFISLLPLFAVGVLADLFDPRLIAFGMALLMVCISLYVRFGTDEAPARATLS